MASCTRLSVVLAGALLAVGSVSAMFVPPPLPGNAVFKKIFEPEYIPYLKQYDNPNFKPLQPFIRSMYNELDLNFWRWALPFFFIPEINSPFDFNTGEFCLDRQEGEVNFLAGTFGGLATRQGCAVGPDKWLYIPILNTVFFATLLNETTFEDLESLFPSPDVFDDLTLTIDGEDFGGLIRQTNSRGYFFSSSVSDNGTVTLLTTEYGEFSPYFTSIGFYALVPPLLPGPHNVSFTGRRSDSGFELAVDYAPLMVLEDDPSPV